MDKKEQKKDNSNFSRTAMHKVYVQNAKLQEKKIKQEEKTK